MSARRKRKINDKTTNDEGKSEDVGISNLKKTVKINEGSKSSGVVGNGVFDELVGEGQLDEYENEDCSEFKGRDGESHHLADAEEWDLTVVDGDGKVEGEEDDNNEDATSSSTGSASILSKSTSKASTKKAPANTRQHLYRPGVDDIADNEELTFDSRAYTVKHDCILPWPCLSFDFIPDANGVKRTKFPLSCYAVAGTQAAEKRKNSLHVLKMTELHKTKHDGIEDEEVDEDVDGNDLDDDPVLEHRIIPHREGGINRVRICPQIPNLCAVMSDTGNVNIFDLTKTYDSLKLNVAKNTSSVNAKSNFSGNNSRSNKSVSSAQTPAFVFHGHTTEGYALDWSTVDTGRLLTGDCNGGIHIWDYQSSTAASTSSFSSSSGITSSSSGGKYTWSVSERINAHEEGASVEDLQWSPTESTVFASCSTDRSIRVWDTRAPSKHQLVAHDCHGETDDINVITWNPKTAYLLASGGDDGAFKVWDFRNFRSDAPVANYQYHRAPITSIQWNPWDDSMLAVSGADDQVTIWDLSVEEDDDELRDQEKLIGAEDIPPQLMFVHMGQKMIKELRWHHQIPGFLGTTSLTGFNFFRPDNL
eukprot:g2219.t1